MFRSRRTDAVHRPSGGSAHAHRRSCCARPRATVARAVVGITGDKNIPAWNAATTPRTRRRVVALAGGRRRRGRRHRRADPPAARSPAAGQRLERRRARRPRPCSRGLAYAFAGLLRRRPVRAERIACAPSSCIVVQRRRRSPLLCGLLPGSSPLVLSRRRRASALYGLQVASFRTAGLRRRRARGARARVRAASRSARCFGGARRRARRRAPPSPAPSSSQAPAIVLAGIVSGLLALFSLRLTEPGDRRRRAGPHRARVRRRPPRRGAAHADARRRSAASSQVHTVRTSLSSLRRDRRARLSR